ncbi:MAG: 50S ribosomal protein L22 [Candidatus Levybacteria bacterium]|nr:50S ribosomal protein L22 [Candidatus Levybacteria bacterium]
MDIIAKTTSVHIAPRKMRLVADAIRKVPAHQALEVLEQTRKRAASALAKTLKSAIANAENNAKLEASALFVKQIEIFDGPVLKRFHPSSRGRVHPYKKRTSHVKIVLGEKGGESAKSKAKNVK